MDAKQLWLDKILTPLDDAKTTQAVDDENAKWSYLDSEINKIGTISHAQVDMAKVQQTALELLATETKDMRVLTHLLRTLQHSGDEDRLALALTLFNQYVQHYWANAYPNKKIKMRLAQQIIKRFENHTAQFALLSQDEFNAVLHNLDALATFWQQEFETLSNEINALKQLIVQKQTNQTEFTAPKTQEDAAFSESSSTKLPLSYPSESISIDDSNERNWKKSLQKVADVLFERFPDRPISYQLRRNMLWSTLDGILIVDNAGVTPLAVPVSQDRISDYLAAIAHPSLSVLKQIEESVSKSPYWFEGHFIAASMANALHYNNVANTIKDELKQLFVRLPQLKAYRFSDNTPFLPEKTLKWLEQQDTASGIKSEQDDALIWQCFDEDGLQAALALLNSQTHHNLREQFYQQKREAQLLEKAGFSQLAAQRWQQLEQLAQKLTVAEWEADFFKY